MKSSGKKKAFACHFNAQINASLLLLKKWSYLQKNLTNPKLMIVSLLYRTLLWCHKTIFCYFNE